MTDSPRQTPEDFAQRSSEADLRYFKKLLGDKAKAQKVLDNIDRELDDLERELG